ncbi:flagellar hook-length control protein FliK [Selenomonas ruminantium]|uniref:flagellar hook-length control protein FliK n=1 Tax=Selenomonas ruminantium TaxID=971 RepID=UPI000B0E6FDF|nr:flagellar hook-length control protein FliK [Selenomonas ruminantium]
MNTASLLTISPQAGAAVKSQTPRMVVKTDASSAGMGKENFGDVLEKAGEEVIGKEVKKAMAKSPAEAQGSAAEARDAKINDDVPEGTEALPKDMGKRGEGTPQESKPQQIKDVKGSEKRIAEPEVSGMEEPAAVMAFTMEGNAQLIMEEVPEAEEVQPSPNLQSLLPQSSGDAQKNKNFLAMLSGQQLKNLRAAGDEGTNAVQAESSAANAAEAGNPQREPLTADLLFRQMGMQPVKEGEPVKANTLLEVQLGNHQLANHQLANPQLANHQLANHQLTNPQLANPQLADRQLFNNQPPNQRVVNPLLNQQVQEVTAAEAVLNKVDPAVIENPAALIKGTEMNLQISGADNGKDTMLNAKGMALFQQSEETMPSRTVGEVMSQVHLQQVGDKVSTVQPAMVQAAAKENILPVDDLFGKVPVTVEKAAVMPSPQPDVMVSPAENRIDTQNVVAEVLTKADVKTPVGEVFIAAEQGIVARQSEPRQEVDSKIQMPLINEEIEAVSPIAVKSQKADMHQWGKRQEQDFRQQIPLQPPTMKDMAEDKGQTLKELSEEKVGDKESVLADEALEDISISNVKPQNADMRQMGNRQEQNFRQQRPLQPPPMEKVADDKGQVVQQLSEEAVGDKAPVSHVQEAPSGSVSTFQQDLADSIRGTERQSEIPQNRNVQDNFQVAKQIVDQARLIRRGENTQMVIKLHPDHLGELTLKVSVSANGAVNASFHSDNAQVRTIIENSLVQLKQELNNQGLKVDNVDVYAGLDDGGLPQGEGQQAWQQNQSHNSSSAGHFTGSLDDYGEEAEGVAAAQQVETDAADGVDYRV